MRLVKALGDRILVRKNAAPSCHIRIPCIADTCRRCHACATGAGHVDRAQDDGAGSALLTIGGVLLLWCVRDFFVPGRGSLAPWDPPKHLVVVGLYRFTRNPMYVAVMTVVLGWCLLYRSVWLMLYGLVLTVRFNLRVRWHEEPWLQRQFGLESEAYASRTGRWFPRLRPRLKKLSLT